jgi:hypothetical protein
MAVQPPVDVRQAYVAPMQDRRANSSLHVDGAKRFMETGQQPVVGPTQATVTTEKIRAVRSPAEDKFEQQIAELQKAAPDVPETTPVNYGVLLNVRNPDGTLSQYGLWNKDGKIVAMTPADSNAMVLVEERLKLNDRQRAVMSAAGHEDLIAADGTVNMNRLAAAPGLYTVTSQRMWVDTRKNPPEPVADIEKQLAAEGLKMVHVVPGSKQGEWVPGESRQALFIRQDVFDARKDKIFTNADNNPFFKRQDVRHSQITDPEFRVISGAYRTRVFANIEIARQAQIDPVTAAKDPAILHATQSQMQKMGIAVYRPDVPQAPAPTPLPEEAAPVAAAVAPQPTPASSAQVEAPVQQTQVRDPAQMFASLAALREMLGEARKILSDGSGTSIKPPQPVQSRIDALRGKGAMGADFADQIEAGLKTPAAKAQAEKLLTGVYTKHHGLITGSTKSQPGELTQEHRAAAMPGYVEEQLATPDMAAVRAATMAQKPAVQPDPQMPSLNRDSAAYQQRQYDQVAQTYDAIMAWKKTGGSAPFTPESFNNFIGQLNATGTLFGKISAEKLNEVYANGDANGSLRKAIDNAHTVRMSEIGQTPPGDAPPEDVLPPVATATTVPLKPSAGSEAAKASLNLPPVEAQSAAERKRKYDELDVTPAEARAMAAQSRPAPQAADAPARIPLNSDKNSTPFFNAFGLRAAMNPEGVPITGILPDADKSTYPNGRGYILFEKADGQGSDMVWLTREQALKVAEDAMNNPDREKAAEASALFDKFKENVGRGQKDIDAYQTKDENGRPSGMVSVDVTKGSRLNAATAAATTRLLGGPDGEAKAETIENSPATYKPAKFTVPGAGGPGA